MSKYIAGNAVNQESYLSFDIGWRQGKVSAVF